MQRTNEASSVHFFFFKTQGDCGQRRKELWLSANGRMKMRGMICVFFPFRFSCQFHCHATKKLIRNRSLKKDKKLERCRKQIFQRPLQFSCLVVHRFYRVLYGVARRHVVHQYGSRCPSEFAPSKIWTPRYKSARRFRPPGD